MILSGKSVWARKEEIFPDDEVDYRQVQPASIDLRLGRAFYGYSSIARGPIDPAFESPMKFFEIQPHEKLHLGALYQSTISTSFVLGTTVERIRVPADLVGRLEGRSSVGRLGVVIHATAGWIDPGFDGRITLEIACVAPHGVYLYPGMRIGQISFYAREGWSENDLYGKANNNKYINPITVQPSQMHKDEDFQRIVVRQRECATALAQLSAEED